MFYLLIVRPQQKQRARHQQLMDELRPGKRAVTIGGIHGRVDTVGNDTFGLEVSDGVVLTFSRAALSRFEEESESEALPESDEASESEPDQDAPTAEDAAEGAGDDAGTDGGETEPS